MKINFSIHSFILSSVFFGFTLLILCSGCANQQPPGGGEEDKIPPKVHIISPKPNSTEFRGNSLMFEFNEYVDRRSFQDAFRISPQIKGEIEYDWGAKDVEVRFPAELYKIDANKTFVVNISTGLKDIRGNPILSAFTFAFSTGSKIDMGRIEGSVFNNNNKINAVFAYDINSPKGYDPTKNLPDYLTESSVDGIYSLTNLAPGKYRVISLLDDDRNLLFTSERENYGVLPFDVVIADSELVPNVNFYMKDINVTAPSEIDYNKFFKDSLGIVYTSIPNGSNQVLPDQSIYIFFNQYRPAREGFINSFKIADENGTPEKVVFNWKNDSLVEIFASDKFAANRKYILSFSVKTLNDSIYNFSLPFRTVSTNSFGNLKGTINRSFGEIISSEAPVIISLSADSLLPVLVYRFETKDSVFNFRNILEAQYSLFSFIDINTNAEFDFGYPYPFEPSEPFFIYPQRLNIKGGWTVENVNIKFVK